MCVFEFADSNRLESDLEELNCSLDLVASQVGSPLTTFFFFNYLFQTSSSVVRKIILAQACRLTEAIDDGFCVLSSWVRGRL